MGVQPHLVERDAEFAQLGAALDAAVQGLGSVIVVEGDAGIGKTALLRAVRDLASDRGFRCLTASGAELERDFAWGVTRQLFESLLAGASTEHRAHLLAGAAAPAGVVLGWGETSLAAAELLHAVTHGLYWLTSNLADDTRLLLTVDDAHWADAASLEFLAYLARRCADLPLVLLIAMRPAGAGATVELVDALAGTAAMTLRLPALTEAGTAAVMHRVLGGEAVSPSVARACHEATGGNPFLAEELARVMPDASSDGAAERVRRLVPRTIVRSVLSRISALGETAISAARAIAIAISTRYADLIDSLY